VQTWFPFTLQVYVNGHEWLARQMDKRGLRYRRLENAFLWLEDPGRVQRIGSGAPTRTRTARCASTCPREPT